MKTAHILFTASLALAMAFTFSCSKEDEDSPFAGGGGNGASGLRVVEWPYTKTSDSLTWTETRTEGNIRCLDEGIIEDRREEVPREKTAGYAISNNTLVLTIGSDAINFSGTSSSLAGTWTKTKSQCEERANDPGYKSCKEAYNVVKAEFTESKVKFTVDICDTDRYVSGYTDEDGRKTTVIDCNTIEQSKGTDKVTSKWTATGTEYTYNGKTCYQYGSSSDHYTAAQRNAACKKAWDEREGKEYWEEDYNRILRAEYYDCIKDFPSW